MSLAEIMQYSYDDYKKWEGDWELIEGFPVAMAPSPTKKHQIIAREIVMALQNSLKECQSCEVLYEIDWKVSDYTVVRPDIVVVCNDTSVDYITKTPNIIVEVVSNSTAKIDESIKFELYEKEGVEYYILVYPDDLIAKIYQLKSGKYIKYGDFTKEKANFDTLECKASIDFEEVFKRFYKN